MQICYERDSEPLSALVLLACSIAATGMDAPPGEA
jgi:hypothetical protein